MGTRFAALLSASVIAYCASAPAFAQPLTTTQDAPVQADDLPGSAPGSQTVTTQDVEDTDIVVTGTLVRGIAPAGASVLSITAADVTSTGATTTAQLLQTIPQLASFGLLQIPQAIDPAVTVNRPNLRNLPGFTVAGGSATLVLLDGHRIVGMGLASTTPDPDIIPPGVIERLEIVPDGGSAIYGSDAVAGVLNFITIKRFDGVKVDASYGFADDYYRWDANVTAGRDWGSGSVFVSYAYAKSDELLGIDRDYIREFPSETTGLTLLQCSPGNITALAGVFAPAGTNTNVSGGAPNQCDGSDYATVYPASERHSVFAGLTQQLSDALNFEMRGFYTNRTTHLQNGPYRGAQLISPFPIPGVPTIQSPFTQTRFLPVSPFLFPGGPTYLDLVQNVSFQFGASDAVHTDIELETWGITPTVTADLGGGFQLRVLGSYGESVSNLHATKFSESALRNAISAGLFNPYAPETSNSAALAAITNYEQYGRTRQYYHNFRAILDGDIVTLPGGAAKIAVGAEYAGERFNTQRGDVVPGTQNTGFAGLSINGALVVPAQAATPRFDLSRNVKSVFGEIVVPVFGSDNATGGFQSLTLSAAGRYDDYSDFGGTFNPRFGLTYKPVDWFTIRGTWGKSFNAPSLADDENADVNTLFVLSGAEADFFNPPADLVANGTYPARPAGTVIVAQRGNKPDIEPQKATTWTVGFDVQPTVVPGLTLGATYYNINFDNYIGLPPFETGSGLYRNFGSVITLSPTQAQLDAAVASSQVFNGPSNPSAATTYALFDARKRNIGDFKLDGIDFRLNFQQATGFGSLFLSANGTYELNREQSSPQGTPFVDVLAGANRFRVRSTAGLQYGKLLGQISWNHLAGYDLVAPVGFVPQTKVGAFNTFDLFFKYDVRGEGLTEGLEFTLNVQNVFDQAPPEYRGGSQIAGTRGTTNGGTIGRFVQFGVSKKF